MALLPFNVQLKIVLMVFRWCLVVLLIAMVIIWNSGGREALGWEDWSCPLLCNDGTHCEDNATLLQLKIMAL